LCGLALDHNSPTSASDIAGITDVNLHAWFDFGDSSLFPGQASSSNPPISASHVAVIIGMSHHSQTKIHIVLSQL
jgi:hypothetical protein